MALLYAGPAQNGFQSIINETHVNLYTGII